MPGSAGFIAEVHVLLGGVGRWHGWVILLGAAMLVGAAYSLRVIGRLCLRGEAMRLADMSRSELAAAMLLAGGVLLLGLWQAPLLTLVAGGLAQLTRALGA